MIRIKTENERKNPFLKRKDLTLSIDHAGQATPKKDILIEEISKAFKADASKVEIVYVFSEVGAARSKVKARIWEKEIPKKKVEKKPLEKRPEETKGKEETIEEKKEEKKAPKEPEQKEKSKEKKSTEGTE